MDTSKIYLVQGFFFQGGSLLEIEVRPGTGAEVVVRHNTIRSMYAGIIWYDDYEQRWKGSMDDCYGISHLDSIEFDETKFTFDKYYLGRDDSIHYTFNFDTHANMWLGGYAGEAVGTGNANCILTATSRQMLEAGR